jgi:hypothetical protein
MGIRTSKSGCNRSFSKKRFALDLIAKRVDRSILQCILNVRSTIECWLNRLRHFAVDPNFRFKILKLEWTYSKWKGSQLTDWTYCIIGSRFARQILVAFFKKNSSRLISNVIVSYLAFLFSFRSHDSVFSVGSFSQSILVQYKNIK